MVIMEVTPWQRVFSASKFANCFHDCFVQGHRIFLKETTDTYVYSILVTPEIAIYFGYRDRHWKQNDNIELKFQQGASWVITSNEFNFWSPFMIKVCFRPKMNRESVREAPPLIEQLLRKNGYWEMESSSPLGMWFHVSVNDLIPLYKWIALTGPRRFSVTKTDIEQYEVEGKMVYKGELERVNNQ